MGLAEKIRKAREVKVDAGGYTFLVRRPTDIEMVALRPRILANDVGAMLDFVIGWEGVRELDLLPGGDPHPLPFDAEACAEWLADRPDLIDAVTKAVVEAYQAHVDALASAKKK